MTSQIPSLSYGMPNCPSCSKQGLVLTTKDRVACIFCDFRRDLATTPPKKPAKNPTSDGWSVFLLLLIITFLIVVLT